MTTYTSFASSSPAAINLVPGFEPDFITELSRHPGPRGMQMIVRPVDG